MNDVGKLRKRLQDKKNSGEVIIGGQSMGKVGDSGMLGAAEVYVLLMGGVFPATADRYGAFIRWPVPYA